MNSLWFLEALKLIRVLKGNIKDDTSLKGTPVRAKRKLSERLAGSLTAAQAKALDNELKKIRGEWERSI